MTRMFQSRSKAQKSPVPNGWTDELWNEFKDTSRSVDRDVAYHYVDIETLHASAEMSASDSSTAFYVDKEFVGRLRAADSSALNGMIVHLHLTPRTQSSGLPNTPLPSWARGIVHPSEEGIAPTPVLPTLVMILLVDVAGMTTVEEQFLRAKIAGLPSLTMMVVVSPYPEESRRILAIRGVKIEQSIRLDSH